MSVATSATSSVEFMGPIVRYTQSLPVATQLRIEGSVRTAMATRGVTDDILSAYARVPYAASVAFTRVLERETGDSACMLRAATDAPPDDWGLLHLLCRCAPTFGAGLKANIQYTGIMSDAATVELVIDDELTQVRHRIAPGLEAGYLINDFVMGAYIKGGSGMLGFDAPPLRVELQHAPPPHAALYRERFGCEVVFGQPLNTIVIPTAALDIPLPRADAQLHRVLRNHAEDLLARLPQSRSLAASVRTRIREQLADGAASPEDLAASLSISERTLRRRLSAEGETVSGLVEEVRRQEAARMLTKTNLGVSEIAFALGFAQPPAFHRAFRRWFGLPPLEYRRTTSANALQAMLRGEHGGG